MENNSFLSTNSGLNKAKNINASIRIRDNADLRCWILIVFSFILCILSGLEIVERIMLLEFPLFALRLYIDFCVVCVWLNALAILILQIPILRNLQDPS
jgi:hypothetical protein